MKVYNNMNQIIEANNKYLAFKGTPKEAINFVDTMRDIGTSSGGEFENVMNDFLFNIERDLQDAGIYDEHFNLIDDSDRPEIYSGILKSCAEVMLRKNGVDEWTVDVRDRADQYISGYTFCNYDQAVEKYNKLEEYYNMYPFLEGDPYWTIENGEVVEGTWDGISEGYHDDKPTKVYYHSESEALDAYERMLLNFLKGRKELSNHSIHTGFYNTLIKKIKKDSKRG